MGGNADGQTLWDQHDCGSCHGANADGVPSGISIIDSISRSNLTSVIRDTMPYGNPGACDQSCSSTLASWLRDNFGPDTSSDDDEGSANSEDENANNGSDQNNASNDDSSSEPQIAYAPNLAETELLQLLYKATNNLVGQLPTQEEISIVEAENYAGLAAVVDTLTSEEAFLSRVKEIYNDLFHTDLYVRRGVSSFRRYAEYHGVDEANMEWYRDYDDDEYYHSRSEVYRSMGQEPLALIAHVVRNERPFTEILTADYTVMNYYSARSFNMDSLYSFNTLTDPEFATFPYDPQDYREVRLNIPHAGVLTTAAWLTRHPTTRTNRNRHRARKVFEYFLDVDILSISGTRPSTDDMAEANPTLNNPNCTACHNVMDPVASSFKHWLDSSPFRRDSVAYRLLGNRQHITSGL